jgi:hypothetical protein
MIHMAFEISVDESCLVLNITALIYINIILK